jgi:hypothetical protein
MLASRAVDEMGMVAPGICFSALIGWGGIDEK